MLRKGLPLIAALALVSASATSAQAGLCLRFSKSGGGTLIAKGATLPAPQTCQMLPFVERAPVNPPETTLGGAATGFICTDANGSAVALVHYTYDGCIGPDSYFESATCRFELQNIVTLPSISGGCRGKVSGKSAPGVGDTMHDFVAGDAVLESCNDDLHLSPPFLCRSIPGKGFDHQLDQR